MRPMLVLLLVVTALSSASCKDTGRQAGSVHKADKNETSDTSEATQPLCFLYAVDNDSIALHVVRSKDSIHGELSYNFYQIDGSFGTFSGILKGDTLRGLYDFEAEGTHSKRELIFLKTDDGLIQGQGETELVGHTERYIRNTRFHFNNGRLLKTVDCKSD